MAGLNYSVAYASAQKRFESKKYKEAFDICSQIIEEQGPDFKAMLLMAQSFLLMTNWLNWKENKDAFYEAASNAFKLASSVEEAVEAEYQIRYAIRLWDAQQHRIMLERVRRNPKIEAWKDYLSYQGNSMTAMAFILLALRGEKNVVELYEKKGITKDQFSDMCGERSVEGVFSHDEIDDLKFEIGQEIFEHTVKVIEENKEGSKEYLLAFGQKALDRLYLTKMIISSSISEDTENAMLLVKHLYGYAEVLRYMLNVTVHPNGATMSLVVGDRNDLREELRSTYEKIQKLDPTFTMPSLPDRYGIEPVSSTYSDSSSGGCYVATAVYGSYDCPQVWTLRRFRDDTLAETWYGRAFIRIYYAISPTLVKWFGHTVWFKKLWKVRLDRMVANLNAEGVENTPYEDKQW